MADLTGLSVNSVHKRVQTLIDDGTILGFFASLGPSAERYVIAAAMGETSTDDLEATIAEAGRDEHTSQVIVATNDYIYPQWHMRDMSELDDFIDFCRNVARVREPHVIFRTPTPPPGFEKVRLSGLDYRIINSLAKDARKPETQVAEELGISPKTVHRHLERMQREGSILLSTLFSTNQSRDIFTFFHIELRKGVDRREVSSLLQERYKPHLVNVQMIESDPTLFICNVWTHTMRELKDLRTGVEREDFIESLKVNVLYDFHKFDTWRDEMVRKRAAEAARRDR
jgi:DNA-binding Lrp family transcriptional regulator